MVTHRAFHRPFLAVAAYEHCVTLNLFFFIYFQGSDFSGSAV